MKRVEEQSGMIPDIDLRPPHVPTYMQYIHPHTSPMKVRKINKQIGSCRHGEGGSPPPAGEQLG